MSDKKQLVLSGRDLIIAKFTEATSLGEVFRDTDSTAIVHVSRFGCRVMFAALTEYLEKLYAELDTENV